MFVTEQSCKQTILSIFWHRWKFQVNTGEELAQLTNFLVQFSLQDFFVRIVSMKKMIKDDKLTLYKKSSFPLRIYSVNVTKSAENCGFDHIYWRNPEWKRHFFVQCQLCFNTGSSNLVEEVQTLNKEVELYK